MQVVADFAGLFFAMAILSIGAYIAWRMTGRR